jgi:hypothetical protein
LLERIPIEYSRVPPKVVQGSDQWIRQPVC